MAFPTTPVLDAFPSDVNPINGTGSWSATKSSNNAPSNVQAETGTAHSVSSYGSAVWAISCANPLEFYVTKQNTGGDDYYYWNVQPGSIGGSGTLDCYQLHVPSSTTVSVRRVDNDSDTTLFSAAGITHAAGDVWGISHAANGDIVLYQNGVVRGAGANDLAYTSGYFAFATNWISVGGVDNFGGGQTLGVVKGVQDWRRRAFPFMPMAKRTAEPVGLAASNRESHGPGPIGGFERFIFPRLHPVMATTYYGASSLDTTAAITTNGARVGMGVTASTFTLTAATAGNATARGASTLTLTAGITTAAKVTAKAATASIYTLALTNVGKLTAFGATRFTYGDGTWGEGVFGGQPWLLTITTSGRPLKFGAVAQSITLGITTAGATTSTKYGASSLTLTAGITTAGKLTAKGATTSTYTLSSTTAGSRTRFGTVSAPITFTAASVGRVNAKAATAQTLSLGITTAGAATKFGATSLPVTFSAITNGQVGSGISQTFTFQATTAGAKTTFGVVSRTTTASITTNGARTTTGAVSLPIVFSSTTNATRKTFGAVTVPLALTITTGGSVPAVTYFGATSLPITFSKSVAGNRVHYGTATLPVALTITTAATRATAGAASLTITLGINTDGVPPATLDEIITGWLNGGSRGVIAGPKVGGTRHSGGSRGTIGSGASGRIKQPVGGGIE